MYITLMNKTTILQDNNQIIILTTLNSSIKKRILLVDDEPDITLTFKIALESTGLFEVYTFNESLQALANFKSGFYHLVLTDIKMPKMNGYEFSQKIKEIDNYIKICSLTASEIYHGDCEQKGANYFIKKPLAIDELVKQINSILE
jgi:two-component system, OmpR family, response regulator ChvI